MRSLRLTHSDRSERGRNATEFVQGSAVEGPPRALEDAMAR